MKKSPDQKRNSQTPAIKELPKEGSFRNKKSLSFDRMDVQEFIDAETKYEILFESANDSIIIMDRDMIVDCNQNTADLFSTRRENIINRTTYDYWPDIQPDGRPSRESGLEKVRLALAGDKRPFEWRHKRADGTFIDTYVTLNIFKWKGKKYLQAIIRDNTQFTSVRSRLEAINKCWLGFGANPLVNINNLLALCGRELSADCAFYNLIKEDKIISICSWNAPADFQAEDGKSGHICTDIVSHPTNNIQIIRDLQNSRYAVTDPNVSKYNLKTYVGKPVTFENKNIGVLCLVYTNDMELAENDLKLLGIIASAIGVEETRRHVIIELYESEERFRLLVANSPDLVFALDKHLKVVAVNENISRKYGYSLIDIIGKDAFEFIHEEDRKKLRTYIYAQFYVKKETALVLEIRFTDKKKEKWWDFELSANIQYDVQGKYLRAFAIARDITERKRLESQLLQAQKMEAVGTLAGGIAHDFNNLLMGIQGNASLMLLTSGMNDPNRERLMSIQQQVQSGSELTLQLLGFARGGKYNVQPVDIRELVSKSADLFGRTKKEIAIHQNYPNAPCLADVDRVQIEQVLLNLYLNAWQAMPGGGRLFISVDNIMMEESIARTFNTAPGNYVKISIQDTGVGMDQMTLARIFEPFFTTKEMGHGVGLGLASAYGIIKNHKGMIDVESEKGQGTTFIIYLPASDKELIKELPADENILKGAGTILLVDDEQVIIDVTQDILKMIGYDVLTAISGQEAIDIYRQKKDEIDIVIMDMIMPVMGGSECFDGLKQINPAVKVILSSGYSMTDQAQSIMQKGCDGFIQKPFSIKDLSRKVKETMDKK